MLAGGCRAPNFYAVTRPVGAQSPCVLQCEKFRVLSDDADAYLRCLVACPEVRVGKNGCPEPVPRGWSCAEEEVSGFSAGRTVLFVVLVDVIAGLLLLSAPRSSP